MSSDEIKHPQNIPQIWKNALTTSSLEENKQLYKEWASAYDKDLTEHGYDAPKVSAVELNRALTGFCAGTERQPQDFTILDVGSGTGMVAELLAPMGYRLIDALDTSQEMLDVAEGKGVYRTLICADGSDAAAVAAESYDVVISLSESRARCADACGVCASVGTFTPGHLGGSAIDSVLKYIKKGGFFVVAVRCAYWRDPASKMRETCKKLENAGQIELFALSPELPYHLSEPSVKFQCWTYRVLP